MRGVPDRFARVSLAAGALPTNDHQAFCRISYLPLAGDEAVDRQHFLWSLIGHSGKYRPSAGQPQTERPRQVEKIITNEEHPEHVRTTNDANAGIWRPERCQGFFE